jgi:hypothetical protein
MASDLEKLRAALAVHLDLLGILFRQCQDKEKIISDFHKETESLSTAQLNSTLSDEYLEEYRAYRDIVLTMLEIQRRESSGD